MLREPMSNQHVVNHTISHSESRCAVSAISAHEFIIFTGTLKY